MKSFELIGVAFLDESKLGAGYPVSVSKSDLKVPSKIKSLGSANAGSGHDCFLKGIQVMMDVTATSYQSLQFNRYHFFDYVSSQSKMYKITEFDILDKCTKNVDSRIIDIAREYIIKYKNNECDIETMLDNTPQGLTLTARVSTNYLQLKTMYLQRKNHKLKFWNTDFVEFCNELPEFIELIVKNK